MNLWLVQSVINFINFQNHGRDCKELIFLENVTINFIQTIYKSQDRPTVMSNYCNLLRTHQKKLSLYLSKSVVTFHSLRQWKFFCLGKDLRRNVNYCLNVNVSSRQRVVPKGTIRDVYDGQTWEDFKCANKFDLFRKPRKYGLMLNLDWFCPYEQIKNFPVGVFYLVVLTLSRHIKFRHENVIICGISSRFSHEPPTNTFVAPLVEELKNTWNDGFEYYSTILKKQKGFILAWFVLDVTTS